MGEIKQDYALATRELGTYKEYTLIKNGLPQLCPFKSRIPMPDKLGQIQQLDQNCTDSCPMFRIIELNKSIKVSLHCGGAPVVHEFYPAKDEEKKPVTSPGSPLIKL